MTVLPIWGLEKKTRRCKQCFSIREKVTACSFLIGMYLVVPAAPASHYGRLYNICTLSSSRGTHLSQKATRSDPTQSNSTPSHVPSRPNSVSNCSKIGRPARASSELLKCIGLGRRGAASGRTGALRGLLQAQRWCGVALMTRGTQCDAGTVRHRRGTCCYFSNSEDICRHGTRQRPASHSTCERG